MEIPSYLETVINEELNKFDLKKLKEYSKNLSEKYMNEKRTGKSLLSKAEEALAYSVIRMPATFNATLFSIKKAFEYNDIKINSLLDVGAGVGTSSFACNEYFDLEKITCIERENAMFKLGKKFMKNSNQKVLQNAIWLNKDIVKDEINEKADLVITSYMINELSEENRIKVVEKLLEMTNKVLIIIEPRNSSRIFKY